MTEKEKAWEIFISPFSCREFDELSSKDIFLAGWAARKKVDVEISLNSADRTLPAPSDYDCGAIAASGFIAEAIEREE